MLAKSLNALFRIGPERVHILDNRPDYIESHVTLVRLIAIWQGADLMISSQTGGGELTPGQAHLIKVMFPELPYLRFAPEGILSREMILPSEDIFELERKGAQEFHLMVCDFEDVSERQEILRKHFKEEVSFAKAMLWSMVSQMHGVVLNCCIECGEVFETAVAQPQFTCRTSCAKSSSKDGFSAHARTVRESNNQEENRTIGAALPYLVKMKVESELWNGLQRLTKQYDSEEGNLSSGLITPPPADDMWMEGLEEPNETTEFIRKLYDHYLQTRLAGQPWWNIVTPSALSSLLKVHFAINELWSLYPTDAIPFRVKASSKAPATGSTQFDDEEFPETAEKLQDQVNWSFKKINSKIHPSRSIDGDLENQAAENDQTEKREYRKNIRKLFFKTIEINEDDSDLSYFCFSAQEEDTLTQRSEGNQLDGLQALSTRFPSEKVFFKDLGPSTSKEPTDERSH